MQLTPVSCLVRFDLIDNDAVIVYSLFKKFTNTFGMDSQAA